MNDPAIKKSVLKVLAQKNTNQSIQFLLSIVDPDHNRLVTADELGVENMNKYVGYSIPSRIHCSDNRQIILSALSALLYLKYDKYPELMGELRLSTNKEIAEVVYSGLYAIDPALSKAYLSHELKDTTNERQFIFDLFEVSYSYNVQSELSAFINYFQKNKVHDEADYVLSGMMLKHSMKQKQYIQHFKEMVYLKSEYDENYFDWLENTISTIYFEPNALIDGLKKDFYNSIYPLCGVSYDYVLDTNLLVQKKQAENRFEQDIRSKINVDKSDSLERILCFALLDTALFRDKGIVEFDQYIMLDFKHRSYYEYFPDSLFIKDLAYLKERQVYYSEVLGIPKDNISLSKFTYIGNQQYPTYRNVDLIAMYLGIYGDETDIYFLENLMRVYPNDSNNFNDIIQEIRELRL